MSVCTLVPSFQESNSMRNTVELELLNLKELLHCRQIADTVLQEIQLFQFFDHQANLKVVYDYM